MDSWNSGVERHLPWWANLLIVAGCFAALGLIAAWALS